ncbi:hypothetical protein MKW98_027416 [Papaver atlanticum]|uniref:Uncharacterized protein n=1 Tax=Papaver atlanticum TaxID=357466 RepID=A0AAD4XXS1_9MAGN|nr:hypothetical protein MKW98_027416 [Papaver atlanticum]
MKHLVAVGIEVLPHRNSANIEGAPRCGQLGETRNVDLRFPKTQLAKVYIKKMMTTMENSEYLHRLIRDLGDERVVS